MCPDHISALRKAEQAILHSGLFAQAAPRGDGKTERTKGAGLWASVYGHRKFTLLIGATGSATSELLDGVRFYLQSAADLIRDEEGAIVGTVPGLFPLLLEDFPEIVYPVVALEGESKRQGGQRCQGDKTDIHWGGGYITFPTVPPGNWIDGKTMGPAPGAGARVAATSITGRLRGFNVNGARPDLVLPDDPQTDETADSPAGNEKIEKLLARAVIGLAGPGKKIAGIMPCTVIQQGDAIDNILSHEKHPEWDSSRTKMVYDFPLRMKRNADKPDEPSWEEYSEIRNGYDPVTLGDKRRAAEDATLYYLPHSEDLGEGARIAWPERFAVDELDALQAAMSLFFQDEDAFWSEYQNAPKAKKLGNVAELSKEEIANRLNNHPRLIVPHGATKLTAFIDVQGIGLLWYMVCAWRDDFTGWLIDYGTSPDQGKRYFTKASASFLLQGGDQGLHAGIKELAARLLKTEFKTEGGGAMMVDLLLIDSGHQAELVYEACRQLRAAGFGARVLPSKGEGDRATKAMPFNSNKKPDGGRRGPAWDLPPPKDVRGIRLLRIEVNYWKAFVRDRVAVKDGAKGSLTFWGSAPKEHRMLIDHITAEERDRVESELTGREVDEFHKRISNADEDLGDCLVGCAAAASVCDVRLEGLQSAAKPRSNGKPGGKSWSEMQRQKSQRR